MVWDSINSPSDLKNLSISELEQVCDELRTEIVRLTYKNGGHLGSNLGAIELIVALHYVFDSPLDKFVFDVGHQTYAHKILTGRKEVMENLRSESGASGFIDPDESLHDHFISGHAGNAISAALGIAKANELDNNNLSSVISIIGDGSISCGMTYEALNNIGNAKNFIIILNDNQMSISKTVGNMNLYLNRLFSSQKMLLFRQKTRYFLDKLPKKMSVSIEKFIKNIIFTAKGKTIFEDFGLQYVGPIDGHNLGKLIETLQNVKNFAKRKPVIVHAITKKGNGHSPAENDSYKLHGVDRDREKTETFTDIFSKKIVELGENNEKIICITAAMAGGCGLTEFATKFPNRFFDVGIAESHAVTYAAGLAKQGYCPFVCMYSTFLQRAFDQIYHDVVLDNLPVRFIINKAGFPGRDGKTHSGIYDIAMLSMFENFQIFSPFDRKSLINSLEFASIYNNGPLSIRFSKSGTPEHNCDNKIGGDKDTLVLQVGNNIVLPIDNADVFYVYKIQPFNYKSFLSKIIRYTRIFVVEEGVYGGFSAVLLEYLVKNGYFDIVKKIKIVNIPKTPVVHDSVKNQIYASRMLDCF
ncbi:MAG: 1-deoxy-D-xylulose-5-phosphate synthase [Holosporales bacterium]|jgi:1-deoxy-D-xylulose-5-phosphate synthase|nr:1-deoxy-D-xylulose-5-phosphate synthase [Holosporales bacterium]